MALHRPTPKCEYCNKPIAEAIYRSQDNIPDNMRLYGDTFIKWEYRECGCEASKKAIKKLKKEAEKLDLSTLLKK